ncbi:MAG TPA: hypothetical protein VIR02_20795, partial [Anaerolineales bacterium]
MAAHASAEVAANPQPTLGEGAMMQPELIADYQCQIGENPLWHPLEHCLYWTDIPRGRLFR